MFRLWLVAVGCMALSLPLIGQADHVPQPDIDAKVHEFEVSSVKPSKGPAGFFRFSFTPDGVRMENTSLLMIIRASYGLFNSLDDKFLGLPSWAKTERFDIEAKVSPEDADAYQKLSIEQKRQMMQSVLADRFKLQAHRETKLQPVYLLVVAKGGSKLTEAKAEINKPNRGGMSWSKNYVKGNSAAMPQLVQILTQATGRTVLDKTGLTGKYDFTMHWVPDDEDASMAKAADTAQPPNEATPALSGPSIFTAVQEQLGLKLEPAKGPVECLVIDHVEQPTEN